ncbi:MAG: hypothetical protein WCT85_03055 [Parachlamydiales bacterium]|jgi:hypothetical protein
MTSTANDIITVCSAEDALNIASSYYIEVNKKTNVMLDLLRKEQSNSINEMIKASFGIAHAICLQAAFEAGMQTCIAISSGNALYGINKTEKEINPQIKSLDDSTKNIDKRLRNEYSDAERTKLPNDKKTEFDTQKQQLADIKKSHERAIEKHRGELNSVQAKAQQKATVGAALAQGLASIPKGLQDAYQKRADAVKSVNEQTQQQFASSYDKSLQTLRGFLDINYLAGVVALSSIQLR